jgi:hypothetical protein
VVATSSPLPMLAAAPPTTEEYAKLTLGLSRIDYLLDNWDSITSEAS